jgi:hypothetical protein
MVYWNLLFVYDCTVHLLTPACIILWQSLNESHIPDALLERLVTGTREFPPVCAVIGGILGQVLYQTTLLSLCYEHIRHYFDMI